MNFSVVITTYNRPDFLALSLESALIQSVDVKEITIIDDNSKVDYSDVLSQFKDSRIRYIKQRVSGGANVARNRGIKESSGDVVAFLDDDDIWLPSYLAKHEEKYKKGAEAVVSGFKHLGNDKEIRVNADEKVTRESLVRGNKYCGMSGFSCSRAVLENFSFDETLNNGQDWDMFVRLYLNNIVFYNISEPIFLYRFQNPDGIGAKLRLLKPADIEKRLGSARKHKDFLGNFWFKVRIAEQILFSLNHRSNKWQWLLLSLKKAGFLATGKFFYTAASKKIVKYIG